MAQVHAYLTEQAVQEAQASLRGGAAAQGGGGGGGGGGAAGGPPQLYDLTARFAEIQVRVRPLNVEEGVLGRRLPGLELWRIEAREQDGAWVQARARVLRLCATLASACCVGCVCAHSGPRRWRRTLTRATASRRASLTRSGRGSARRTSGSATPPTARCACAGEGIVGPVRQGERGGQVWDGNATTARCVCAGEGIVGPVRQGERGGQVWDGNATTARCVCAGEGIVGPVRQGERGGQVWDGNATTARCVCACRGGDLGVMRQGKGAVQVWDGNALTEVRAHVSGRAPDPARASDRAAREGQPAELRRGGGQGQLMRMRALPATKRNDRVRARAWFGAFGCVRVTCPTSLSLWGMPAACACARPSPAAVLAQRGAATARVERRRDAAAAPAGPRAGHAPGVCVCAVWTPRRGRVCVELSFRWSHLWQGVRHSPPLHLGLLRRLHHPLALPETACKSLGLPLLCNGGLVARSCMQAHAHRGANPNRNPPLAWAQWPEVSRRLDTGRTAAECLQAYIKASRPQEHMRPRQAWSDEDDALLRHLVKELSTDWVVRAWEGGLEFGARVGGGRGAMCGRCALPELPSAPGGVAAVRARSKLLRRSTGATTGTRCGTGGTGGWRSRRSARWASGTPRRTRSWHRCACGALGTGRGRGGEGS